jgi:site-specific DNA recombinase
MTRPRSAGQLLKCAIYTRVSTDDQARGDYSSLDSQRDICQHYISIHQADGWTPSLYFEDPGFSGKDMDRPGVQALMAAVDSGEVNVIVTYKLDRIGRSLPDFYAFWQRLERKGVEFVSATQNFDTSTPMGRLMLNVLLSFGQFERELTAERTAHKLGERAKHGRWNGGWCPLGYEYDKATQQLRPQAEEAKLIEDVYGLAVKLRNATEVAKALNAAGKRTRQRVLIRKDGSQRVVGVKRFRCDRVDAIVSNPIYKGVIRHGDEEYPSQHPALVSKDLWDRANKALHPTGERTRAEVYKRDKHVHILKGLLRCGHCGTALTPYPAGKKDRNGHPYLYYACTHVVKDGGASKCPVRSIPARSFEDIIVGYIGELGRHPEIIAATIEASNRAKIAAVRPIKAKLARMDKEFLDVSSDVQSCVEAAKKKGAGHISEAFIAEAERLATRKHELDIERQKLRIDLQYRERVVTDEKVIADSLLRFESVMKAMSPDEQKEFVQLLVKQIVVNHFDPERDQIPAKEGVFKTNIRTSWYLVNVDLFATD